MNPANVTAIQKMPGAALLMVSGSGLNTKLKTRSTRNAKKHIALIRSLVRTSVLKSFRNTAET